jgi:two-component system, chemotaxis family, chemotaxis protein CheY
LPAKILVVDDNAAIRQVFEIVLGRAGYDVTEAVDGVDALEKLEAGCFDLVITDLALPRVSGLQVIRWIKQTGCCPVVAMTAHWQTSGLTTEAEELGCDGLLAKPFDQRQLVELVAEQLAHRSAPRPG